MSSKSEKKQVQFRAPRGPVDRAGTPAVVFKTDRADILASALREYLRDATHFDEVKQEAVEAYYGDAITSEKLKSLVGHGEAANFRLLKRQLNEALADNVIEELADT